VAAGAFYIGYVLLEVPSNLVLRRVGARRWLARIMITWGLAAAGTALARGPHSLYLLRVITGAAEAGFYPGVIFYLSTWFPQQYRARAFGWFNLANPMASVVSGPLSAALLHFSGTRGLAGWQWLFILEGLPACLLGLYTLYFLPDRPSAVSWLSAEEQAATAAVLAAEHHPGVTTKLGAALRDRRVVILTISYFCLIVGVLGVTLWLPLMLKQHGLSTTAIGWNTWPYLLVSIGLIVWSAYILIAPGSFSRTTSPAAFAAAGLLCPFLFDSLPPLCRESRHIDWHECLPPAFFYSPSFQCRRRHCSSTSSATLGGSFALTWSDGSGTDRFPGPKVVFRSNAYCGRRYRVAIKLNLTAGPHQRLRSQRKVALAPIVTEYAPAPGLQLRWFATIRRSKDLFVPVFIDFNSEAPPLPRVLFFQ
jgi:MFS family permease